MPPLESLVDRRDLDENSSRKCNDTEEALGGLALEAKDVAEELRTLLSSLKIDDAPHEGSEGRPAKRRRTAAKCAVKSMFKKKDVDQLRSRLNDLQQQLVLKMLSLQWYVSTSHRCHWRPGLMFWCRTSSSDLVKGSLSGAEQQIAAEELAKQEKLVPLMVTSMQRQARTTIEAHAAANFGGKLQGLLSQAQTLATCHSVIRTLAFADIGTRQEDIPQAHTKTFGWIFDDEAYTQWASKSNGKRLPCLAQTDHTTLD